MRKKEDKNYKIRKEKVDTINGYTENKIPGKNSRRWT